MPANSLNTETTDRGFYTITRSFLDQKYTQADGHLVKAVSRAGESIEIAIKRSNSLLSQLFKIVQVVGFFSVPAAIICLAIRAYQYHKEGKTAELSMNKLKGLDGKSREWEDTKARAVAAETQRSKVMMHTIFYTLSMATCQISLVLGIGFYFVSDALMEINTSNGFFQRSEEPDSESIKQIPKPA